MGTKDITARVVFLQHYIGIYIWCGYILEVVHSNIDGNFTDPRLYCYFLQISKGIFGQNQL